MIYLPMLLIAVVCLAPLAYLYLRPAAARGRRESALALHRTQLADLDRDLAEGRLAQAEYASAKLEVQRRMLRVSEQADSTAPGTSGTLLAAAFGLVPAAALLLYLTGGQPGMPSVPHAELVATAQRRAAEATQLIAKLQDKLKTLDPNSSIARTGYIMLGQLEVQRGDPAAAAVAWKTALASQFDPTLAARTADALSAAAGKVTPEAAALFRQALAAAPKDVPWRAYAEQRLASAGG